MLDVFHELFWLNTRAAWLCSCMVRSMLFIHCVTTRQLVMCTHMWNMNEHCSNVNWCVCVCVRTVRSIALCVSAVVSYLSRVLVPSHNVYLSVQYFGINTMNYIHAVHGCAVLPHSAKGLAHLPNLAGCGLLFIKQITHKVWPIST